MNLLNNAEKIAEGAYSYIYQLYDDSFYGQQVVLKVIKDDFNFYPHTSQLKNEYQLVKDLVSPGVRKILDFTSEGTRDVLVLEYIDGVTLKSALGATTGRSILDDIKLAVAIAEALQVVHREGIIHRDLSAYNILVSDYQRISLIDFGIASKTDIRKQASHSKHLEGTLPYLSPEQTGRVNYAVDTRSDLYSLGVVLYEVFTRQLPFVSDDPMELIHAHLARVPTPPSTLLPELPAILSQIIMKLLAKAPENRYQSISGLLADLKACMEQASLTVQIGAFDLAKNDFSGRLSIPTKLYGREDQIGQLIHSISSIGKGRRELTLVKGKAGTGKSALLFEIYKPVTERGGFFIKGKHEQMHRDRPYLAIIAAFKSLIEHILSEPDEELNKWAIKIRQAVGDQGKILTNLMPDLELVIGKQKDLPTLGLSEAQNRFQYIFNRFVEVFATADHPVILFLDDLQWADTSSLRLIKSIVTNPSITHLYFIGSYRQNEVDISHPASIVFSSIQEEGVYLNEITLGNLAKQDTLALIKDTFKCGEKWAGPLNEVLQEKTAGNPFFTIQFLKTLYEEGLLSFTDTQQWVYDLASVKQANFSENVLEFMVDKLKKLPMDVQRVLMVGACVGDEFGLKTLTQLSGQTGEELIGRLLSAAEEQLLFVSERREEDFEEVRLDGIADSQAVMVFRFVHDRVRQAAYNLLHSGERAEMHQQIGQAMLKSGSTGSVFDLVHHLNLSPELFKFTIRVDLIRYNLKAGNQACAATAYDAGQSYLENAVALSESADWDTNYNLMFNMYLSVMDVYYIQGLYDSMSLTGEILLDKAKNRLHRLKTHNILVHSLIAKAKHLETLDYGIAVLAENGVKIPRKPGDMQILAELMKTKLFVGRKGRDFFEGLPETTEEQEILINMMTSLSTAAYHNYPKLFPVLICKSIKMSIKKGYAIDSIPFYGGYGTLLAGVLGEYKRGLEFGKLSMAMVHAQEKFKSAIPKTEVIFYTFINHWKNPMREAVPALEEVYLLSLEIGDNQYAATCAFQNTLNRLVTGEPLKEALDHARVYLDQVMKLKQEMYYLYTQIATQTLINLHTEHAEPWVLEGEVFSLEKQPSNEDQTAQYHILYHQLFVNYLFYRFEEAYQAVEEIQAYAGTILSTAHVPTQAFYHSLICLARAREGKDTSKMIKKVKVLLKKLRNWASHSPTNYEHKYLLVEAELRSFEKDPSAISFYQKSIEKARDHLFLNEQALANELTARYLEAEGMEDQAMQYMSNALMTYRKWGAGAKVKSILEDYPSLSGSMRAMTRQSFGSQYSYGTYGTMSGAAGLDLSSVMKASTTISSEIQLARVIPQLMEIVIENAGAQYGVFMLYQDDHLRVYAESTPSGSQFLQVPVEVSSWGKMSLSVVNYVARTHHAVVLEDHASDDRFDHDEYFKMEPVASLLCLPILYQGEMLGVIYLENKVTKGAFNQERTDLLSLLSGQIAISINNALLYDSLEQKVRERTSEIEAKRQELNEKNHELQDLNREKDFLMSVVSHDLRNPIHLMKGYSNLILKNPQDTDVPVYLDALIQCCNRMDGFIRQILNIQAINERKIELRPVSLDILHVIEQEVALSAERAREKGIVLKVAEESQTSTLSLDKNYLCQIIDNLVSNGIKYTQSSGEVVVSIKVDERHVVIQVSDNGQGISTRDQKLLFSRFKPLSSTPTAGESSTGLGLAIVKRYVDAMGGSIRCESELGEGTTFFVRFPLITEPIIVP